MLSNHSTLCDIRIFRRNCIGWYFSSQSIKGKIAARNRKKIGWCFKKWDLQKISYYIYMKLTKPWDWEGRSQIVVGIGPVKFKFLRTLKKLTESIMSPEHMYCKQDHVWTADINTYEIHCIQIFQVLANYIWKLSQSSSCVTDPPV